MHATPLAPSRPLQALLAGGANLAGKAAMTELAYDFSGQNCFHGCPENPAAPGRLPGGSSSGCAVSAGRKRGRQESGAGG